MPTRDPSHLESLLRDIIDSNNPTSEEAETGIAFIQKSFKLREPSSLAYIDEAGRSFLGYALEKNARLIAWKLFELLENNDEIIFGKDNKGRTLIWHAAKQGYIDITKKLIELAEKRRDVKSNFILWGADEDGVSPLHAAAANGTPGNEIVIQTLLEKIIQYAPEMKNADENTPEERIAKIINAPDRQGQTILHGIMSFFSSETTANLLNHGADLTLHNNKQITPMMFFCKLTAAKQTSIFTLLDKKARQHVFDAYRHILDTNQNIEGYTAEEIRKQYYRIATIDGLSSLICAHLDVNPDIELRNTYLHTENRKVGNEFELTRSEKMLDAIQLQHFPIYARRLKEQAEERHYKLSQIMEGKYVEKTEILRKNSLDEDRTKLSNLITEIDTYLNGLQPRAQANKKIILKSARISVLLTYTAILAYLIYWTETTPRYVKGYDKHGEEANISDYVSNIVTTVCFSIFGCLGTCCCWTDMNRCLSRFGVEGKVKRNEWQIILDKLLSEILNPLRDLQSAAKEGTLLPTATTNIINLDKQYADLNKRIKPYSQLIKTLKEVKGTLEKIQQDMNISNTPITHANFFKPITLPTAKDHIAIEMEVFATNGAEHDLEQYELEVGDEELLLRGNRNSN